MSRYTHILAAVDVTDEASKVLEKAHQAAEDHGAKLSVITVVRPLTQAYTGIEVAGLASAALNFEAEARASVDKSLREACSKFGIDAADRQVCFGVPATEIKRAASREGADLIIMGSHGKHGLGLLLGSTANAVLHGSECDVLTIRV